MQNIFNTARYADKSNEKIVSAMCLHMADKWSKYLSQYEFLENTTWKRTRSLVLFGLGIGYMLGSRFLIDNGYSISYLCDNDMSKWGQGLDGITVISPEQLNKLDSPFVLIMPQTPKFSSSIKAQLEAMGIPCMRFAEYVLLSNRDRVEEVFGLISDYKSALSYCEMLRMRLDNTEWCRDEVFDADIYFSLPEFRKSFNNADEVFIDAGAHVGTDTERFVWLKVGVFKKIYCFEPSSRVYGALCNRVERLKGEFAVDDGAIECVQAGLFENSGLLAFDNRSANAHLGGSFCSKSNNGDENLNVVALDDFLHDIVPTFLKADIEGAELSMLKGARQVISEYKPKIAMSVYHSPQDLFELPLYIKELNSEYSFAFRQHSYNMDEGVLYCFMDVCK